MEMQVCFLFLLKMCPCFFFLMGPRAQGRSGWFLKFRVLDFFFFSFPLDDRIKSIRDLNF